jgi:hypothetical protein
MPETRNPLTQRPPEPAEQLRHARRPQRSAAKRQWDAENQPTGYRLDPSIPDRIREVQRYYREHGYQVTLSQIAQDLLWYALDAWDQGQVSIDVVPLQPTARSVSKNDRSG